MPRFTATVAGAEVDFECASTITSRWINQEILAGRNYPWLPFLDDVQVIFDVGANCGAASLYFALHCPGAQVHAFEPGSEPRALLERNAAGRPQIQVHPIGLYSADASLPLYRGDGDSILGSIHRRDVNVDDSELVELRHGGEWAAEHGIDRIDVLKVDVEGCEIDVLESLAPLLPTVQALYVEYDTRAAKRALHGLLDATHELYRGAMFLGQGECIYLRHDIADRPAANEHLLVLLREGTPGWSSTAAT